MESFQNVSGHYLMTKMVMFFQIQEDFWRIERGELVEITSMYYKMVL